MIKHKSSLQNKVIGELRASKPYILIICYIFVLSGILGYVFSDNLLFLNPLLEKLLTQARDLNGTQLTFFILINNAQSAFLGLILGLFFGFFPVINAFFNGLVIGYVFALVVDTTGANQLWRILPHGIFELPAIFISLGMGLRLGASIFTKEGRKNIATRIHNSVLVFFLVILPLLIIAAIIESLLITFY